MKRKYEKIVIVELFGCDDDCPYFTHRQYRYGNFPPHYCDNAEREMFEYRPMPEWCPLEKVKEVQGE